MGHRSSGGSWTLLSGPDSVMSLPFDNFWHFRVFLLRIPRSTSRLLNSQNRFETLHADVLTLWFVRLSWSQSGRQQSNHCWYVSGKNTTN